MKNVTVNILIVALSWVVARVLTLAMTPLSNSWLVPTLTVLAASILGSWLALRYRAVVAAVLMISTVAYSLASLFVHGVFGIQAAQGGPTNMAILAAAFAGTVLGLTALSYLRVSLPPSPQARVLPPRDSDR